MKTMDNTVYFTEEGIMENIKTERLVLVPISSEYLESTYDYSSDKDNIKLMVFLPHESVDETKKYLKECEKQWERFYALQRRCECVGKKENGQNLKAALPEFLEFAIIFEGKHVGGMTLYILDEGKTAELGWVMDKAYQGKGLVTEAANSLMDLARECFSVCRVIAQCDVENFASRRVAEKLGMTLVKTDGVRKNRGSEESRVEYTYEIRF